MVYVTSSFSVQVVQCRSLYERQNEDMMLRPLPPWEELSLSGKIGLYHQTLSVHNMNRKFMS